MSSSEIESQWVLPAGLPRPIPSTEGLSAEFWAATLEHRLMIQRCIDCRHWQWGPEIICRACGSESLGYEQVEPEGEIYSWQRCWYPVHPALKETVPYLVVIVELAGAEGVRMIGNLVGDGQQKLAVGDRVTAVFEDHPGDDPYTLAQWQRV
ncbi:MAG: DNA-binding protein [Gammaproteobacteria bacterium]|nr:MAG: DNA-binding protein [Gammaproteobacteria bacterium]